jgi:hypothetical protein
MLVMLDVMDFYNIADRRELLRQPQLATLDGHSGLFSVDVNNTEGLYCTALTQAHDHHGMIGTVPWHDSLMVEDDLSLRRLPACLCLPGVPKYLLEDTIKK